MVGKYVLNYFPLAGRAEPARLMFHLAGVEFTDNQIPFSEWPQQKDDATRFPLQQMPTLEVDGVVICQSSAIYSFLANEFNLYGSNNMERASIDQIRESLRELFEGFAKIHWDKSKDEAAKKAAFAEYYGDAKTKRLTAYLTNQVKSSNGKYFIGDKVCVADIIYFVYNEYAAVGYPAVVNEYPELTALSKAVADIEPIRKYLSTRKHSQ